MDQENPKRKILLIEDDYESMVGLKEHLEEEGWSVELTADESILKRLSKERFDLILLDIMIQPTGYDNHRHEVKNIHFAGTNWQKTGLEFLRRLRGGEFSGKEGTPADVSVITLSAIAENNNIKKPDTTGQVNLYLEKPFRLNDVLSLIKKVTS